MANDNARNVDRAWIKELFSTPAKAWWDSADDPNIRVLKVTPDDAEFWDTPGSVISYVKNGGGRRRGYTAEYRREQQGRDVDADRTPERSSADTWTSDRTTTRGSARQSASRSPTAGTRAGRADAP